MLQCSNRVRTTSRSGDKRKRTGMIINFRCGMFLIIQLLIRFEIVTIHPVIPATRTT